MADRLFLSKEADELISSLHYETKLEKAALARMAFALSLAESGSNVKCVEGCGGAEMKRPTFVAEDETFIKTLLAATYGRPIVDEEEFFSNKSLVKDHIENGTELMKKYYRQVNFRADDFIAKLVSLVEFAGRRERIGKGLDIFIGKTLLQNKDLMLRLNDTALHANSHLAIMGIPGVGKTQFLLKILADIRVQSDYQTNFVYFDYKGDVVGNAKFLEIAKVTPYRLLDGQSLPVNPFVLPSYDENAIKVSAREKAESFASINNKLGVIQKGALTEAIQAAYFARSKSTIPYPDFDDVLHIVEAQYEEAGKNDDSLIGVLRDLAQFDLFWKHGSERPPLESLTNRTFLVDVHKMPVLKELVAYLVIERIYKEMSVMPDSPVKDGRRTIRTILVIDEAHNYLCQKNIFLQKIIREGRSKGVAVFFASQSPEDYQQDFFDFQQLLEFAFVFQCPGVTSASVQKILGCGSRTAKDLQTEIAKLEPFQVITRGMDKTEEFTKFTAEAFYKSY